MSVALDRYDIAILAVLQRQGRISNKDLAEQVGLSTAPCWRRLRALEESGIIRGYAASLDPASVNLTVTAFAHVTLENHHAESVAEFNRVIQELPEVLESCMTSGNYDYMLKIVCRDMSAYEKLLSEGLLQIRSVRNVSTSFALRYNKLTTELPLYGAG